MNLIWPGLPSHTLTRHTLPVSLHPLWWSYTACRGRSWSPASGHQQRPPWCCFTCRRGWNPFPSLRSPQFLKSALTTEKHRSTWSWTLVFQKNVCCALLSTWLLKWENNLSPNPQMPIVKNGHGYCYIVTILLHF